MNNKKFSSFFFVWCGIFLGCIVSYVSVSSTIKDLNTQAQALKEKCENAKVQSLQDQTQCLGAISAMASVLRGNYGVELEHLGIGAAILQIEGFENKADAEREEVKLREYIEECSKIGPAAWFCNKDLLDRITIRHEVHDKAANGYFLVIEKLEMPTLYSLCGFMWTHNRRPCKEFNQFRPEY
jgi:hypothetical protein